MKDETAVFKWTAAAVGVILVCFSLGYFVLGPSARTTRNSGGAQVVESAPVPVVGRPSSTPDPGLMVVERTDEVEAKRKKKEEEAKKKAEEAKKKAEEEAKKKAEEEAAKASPSPSPTPSPTPEASSTPSEEPTPEPPVDGQDTGDAEGTTTPATPAPVASNELYRVRVGSFGARDSAEAFAAELNGRGYATTIVSEGSTFRLQVGAYREKKTADNIQKELKNNGYDASVSKS